MDKKLYNKIKGTIKDMPLKEFKHIMAGGHWFNFTESGQLMEYISNASGSPICAYSHRGNREHPTKNEFYFELYGYYNDQDEMMDAIKRCKCEGPIYNYPEMVWCDNCGKEI
jgi:hypothetical protein